jgi:hypothetical protein
VAEVADIIRGEAKEYLETRFVTPNQRKAMDDIACCRTAAMGSVPQTCQVCGVEYRLLCSCRNRSCPSCGGEASQKWLEARRQEILPVEYLQVVFAPPPELKVLARYCPEAFYDAVIRAAGQAIIDVGWSKLHALLGCLAQLQTWTQIMLFHLHVHCVVPCGGFSEDGTRWVPFGRDDLPIQALSNRFRSLVCTNIRAAAQHGKLGQLPHKVSVEQLLATVLNRPWSVYANTPFGGAENLLGYLSRYTHRVAITNDRIQVYDDHQVSFRCRKGRDGAEQKVYTIDGQEFLQRFLTHVPPRGFVRIRSYGFLGNRNRKKNVERARQLIGLVPQGEPLREHYQPLRLCPACCAGRGDGRRMPHFAPSPQPVTQLPFTLRAPPPQHLAA